MAKQRIFFLLLLLCSTGIGAQDPEAPPPDPARLSLQTELALAGEVYLELGDHEITVFGAGWKLKSLAVAEQFSLGEREPVILRVANVEATKEPPRKTIDVEIPAEGVEPSGNVSSPSEVLSVDDMPEAYRVNFTDGTIWYVTSGDWQDLSTFVDRKLMEWRVGFDWLAALWSGDWGKVRVLEIDTATAKELYWILHQEMGVIS